MLNVLILVIANINILYIYSVYIYITYVCVFYFLEIHIDVPRSKSLYSNDLEKIYLCRGNGKANV